MRTTILSYTDSKNLHLETNFLQLYESWYSEVNSLHTTQSAYNNTSLFELFTKTALTTSTDTMHSITETTSIILSDGLNCSNFELLFEAKNSYKQIIYSLNIINYVIIIMGIFFNTINLIVLLKSKLNESPYSYLTMLALSDLGALSMVGAEKLRQLFPGSSFVHIYFVMMINIFLSCSMYVTLALTIERFIFVHSPFKAMIICHRSIARKVCFVIFLFSVVRYMYLPFMYTPNCWNGFSQKKHNWLDLHEFLLSLAIPYSIIFVANISLILSLKRQNSSMSVPSSTSTNSFKNGENIQRAKLNSLNRNSLLNESSECEPIIEPKKKFSFKSNTSLPMDPISPKTIIHSNTVNSLFTSSSNITTRFSGASVKTKSSSLYHRTSNTRELRNQKKLTVTLVIILCLLLVSYLPSFLFEESLADFIFGSHDQPTKDSIRPFIIKAIGNRIAIILIYFNCMANFLIYCFCNKKFKNSLKILLRKSCLNKFYLRLLYLKKMYCLSNNNNSKYCYEMEESNNNKNINNNMVCSYYNTYHFKYYQQNKFNKISLKETISNGTNRVPIERKAKSLIIK